MRIGDIVKYYFPLPEDKDKKYILAIISFIGETKLVLDCEDGTCMMISPKNFDRVEIMRSISAKENILVA
jgi:hypothetical protein